MPNKNTFQVLGIDSFVAKYLKESKVSVDPFSNGKQYATYTNDLNEKADSQFHLEALEFLRRMKEMNVSADLVFFDPPYSPRQLSECYKSIGRGTTMQDTQGKSWSDWKTAIAQIVPVDGIVLSFGWNTVGMGKKHGFEIVEILLVCHGGMHNDTICLAEKRIHL